MDSFNCQQIFLILCFRVNHKLYGMIYWFPVLAIFHMDIMLQKGYCFTLCIVASKGIWENPKSSYYCIYFESKILELRDQDLNGLFSAKASNCATLYSMQNC